MEIINKFKDPERWSDYNLVCFFVQLTVIVLTTFLIFRVIVYNNSDFPGYSRKSTAIASFFDDLTARRGEEKLLRKIPSLASDEEYKETNKFIDLKNGGLWLTERQDGMLGILCFGVCFGGVILVFVGAGPLYRLVRHVIASLTSVMWPFFIFVIPFGVWGAIVSIILAVVGYLTLLLCPLILTAHLVLGIVQIRRLRGGRSASSSTNDAQVTPLYEMEA